MIRIDGLVVAYGAHVAVDRVSLRVDEGEFVGLLGPNGAGKTSLFGALCGLLPRRSGAVSIGGYDPATDRIQATRRLGVVPQDLAFYGPLTAHQNLTFFGELHGLSGKSLRDAVDRALDLVRLSERAHERTRTFSGGMKRRLNVAIGLLHHPRVLVLDEPTVGVDAQSRGALLDCFEEVARGGAAVVYATHRMEEAERLCDRVAILDDGRVLACDAPNALVERFGAGCLRVRFERDVPPGFVDELVATGAATEGSSARDRMELVVPRAEEALPVVAERAAQQGLGIASLDLPEPSLETVFLRLTGRRLRDGRSAGP